MKSLVYYDSLMMNIMLSSTSILLFITVAQPWLLDALNGSQATNRWWTYLLVLYKQLWLPSDEMEEDQWTKAFHSFSLLGWGETVCRTAAAKGTLSIPQKIDQPMRSNGELIMAVKTQRTQRKTSPSATRSIRNPTYYYGAYYYACF